MNILIFNKWDIEGLCRSWSRGWLMPRCSCSYADHFWLKTLACEAKLCPRVEFPNVKLQINLKTVVQINSLWQYVLEANIYFVILICSNINVIYTIKLFISMMLRTHRFYYLVISHCYLFFALLYLDFLLYNVFF